MSPTAQTEAADQGSAQSQPCAETGTHIPSSPYLTGLLERIEQARHAIRQMESAARTADAKSAGWGRGQAAETYRVSAVAHEDAAEVIRDLIDQRRDLLEALTELVLYHDVPAGAQDPVVVPLLRASFAAIAKASA